MVPRTPPCCHFYKMQLCLLNARESVATQLICIMSILLLSLSVNHSVIKPFTFLSSFSPLTFQIFQYSAFSPFQPFEIFIFMPFQLYVQLEKLFGYQNGQLSTFKLFQPITFQVSSRFSFFKYSAFLLFHTFSFMFSWRNCSAFKMLSFFNPSLLSFSLSVFSAFEKFSFFCKFLTIHSYNFMHFGQYIQQIQQARQLKGEGMTKIKLF